MGLREIAKGLAATVVFFVVVEALLRLVYFTRNAMTDYVLLPYTIGDEYGPVPPWSDSLRILERDDALIWKNRPSLRRRYVDVFSPVHTEEERASLLRRFRPRLPESLKANPVWEIALNSEGFRDEEFPARKSPSTFRIICLGDSWTFGWNVGQDQAYPQRLKALLHRQFPAADFEVLNLGVGGYSSQQGLELLKARISRLEPDLVVIAFAMNDGRVAGFRDADMSFYKESPSRRAAQLLENLQTYKTSQYLARLIRHKPKSMGEQLRAAAESAQNGRDVPARENFTAEDYGKVEAWTRVPPVDFEKNILEMIGLARSRGAGVILLANELWRESPYLKALETISRMEKAAFVNANGLIAAAEKRIEESLERKLDLRPPAALPAREDGDVEVVFRLFIGDRPVPKAMYIVGSDSRLGAFVPNKVAMHDDGTHGDQRAGDDVWSYAAKLPAGARLFYVYTNSGVEGQWEGLDVPAIRSFKVAGGGRKLYRPIESFGKLYMRADNWHTNAEGYQLIAEALLEVLKTQPEVTNYLRLERGPEKRSG